MTRVADERGFTLVELLVAMTISLIVLSATLTTFNQFETTTRANGLQNDAQDRARNAADQLARTVRNAVSSGSPAPTPVERATSTDLVFWAIDATPPPVGSANATNTMRVRYCLDASSPGAETLWWQAQRWTSATAPASPSVTACPGTGWTTQTVLVDRLVNFDQGQSRPVWSYTYNPVTSSALADLTAIQMQLYVNVDSKFSKGTAEVASAVSLRNANRKPTATFTVSQVNGHVLLNASSSQDPEGQPLSYQWSVDGTVISGATNVRLDYPGLSSGTTHTFTLQVTDSGRLPDSQTQSVTVQ